MSYTSLKHKPGNKTEVKGKQQPKILIVEDDSRLGKSLSDILKVNGYRPLAVLTGKEGVAAAKKEDISLALIDLKLPDISGIEVLKELKKNSPRTEAIILTAFASLNTAMEAVSLGAFSYLQKPYDIERLLLDIHRALERKRAEDALRKAKEKYCSLVESTEDTIYLVDRDCRYLFVNEKYLSRFGLLTDQVISRRYGEFHSPEETKEFAEMVNQVFETGKSVKYEHRSRRDGRYFLRTFSPVKDSEGRTTAITVIAKDISELKEAEEKIRAAYKELETLDKLKTDFLTVAYHEMVTPLTPIVGYTNLLAQGELSDKQKKYVRIIEESASQLEKLIGMLLEVTRIEAEKVELCLEEVSIAEVVNNVLERIKPQADAKKQTISTRVPEGIEVEGDKQKITAIFDSLITNAIKYTGEKGRINIVVEDREEKEKIRVCVADTGIGIPEEHLPMIFERFYMVDTSLTRKGGLGLGLAIVKGYVELHGGEVRVTSELGKGSNFCFTVPKKQKLL